MLYGCINHATRDLCVFDSRFRRKVYNSTKHWSQVLEMTTASLDAMSYDLRAALTPKKNTVLPMKTAKTSTLTFQRMTKKDKPLTQVELVTLKLNEYMVN